MIKLWIDDVRPAPEGYIWCKSVNGAKDFIEHFEQDLFFDYYVQNISFEELEKIEVIDIDYDAGEYAQYGGDYIRFLDWLEETGRNYPIRIHSMNPIGRENMLLVAKKNNWKVVY